MHQHGSSGDIGKPPIPPEAKTTLPPDIAADRPGLTEALGKLQVSDAELITWQALKEKGCTLEDVRSARISRGKNSLNFIRNNVCEARDARLSGSDSSREALQETDPAWYEWLEYRQLPPKNHPRYREARDQIIRQGIEDNERANRDRPPGVQPYPLQEKVRKLMEEAKADGC